MGDACRGGRSKGLRSRVSARAPSRIPASPGCGEARAARRRVRTRHTTLPAVLTYLLVTSCRTISGSSASGGCGTNMAPVSSVPFVTWESLDLRYSTCGEHAEQKGAHIVCTAARARAPPAHILTCACMCMRMCQMPDACACARYAPPVRAEAGASTRALPYSRRSAQPAR